VAAGFCPKAFVQKIGFARVCNNASDYWANGLLSDYICGQNG